MVVEEPLEIRIAGEPLTVTMRTPGHDLELAAGFLVSEGVIAAGRDVRSAIHCGGPGTGAATAPGGAGPLLTIGPAVVGTATAPVALDQVQPEGKPMMAALDWVRGARLDAGDRVE